MDMNRGLRGPAPNSSQPVAAPTAQYASGHQGKRKKTKTDIVKYVAIALLFSATILAVLVIAAIAIRPTGNEKQYIDTDKYQAVFLNGGQVYFGKVKTLNNEFIRIQDIYYLQVNQQVQPGTGTTQNSTTTGDNDVSLVKLGCELHGPNDEMLINREQVIFWENLKTDGQVAKAVEEYRKANPNGQTCTTANNTTTPESTTPANTTTNNDDN